MKIHPRGAILLTIDAFDKKTTGRTLLQKRLYFLEALLQKHDKEALDFNHDSHFYGPYSPTVSDEVTRLVVAGFLTQREDSCGYSTHGFEVKRHHYELTGAGDNAVARIEREAPEDAAKIQRHCETIKALGDINYVDLSIAAKVFFMLKRRDGPLSVESAVEEARNFSWQIPAEKVRNSFQTLIQLGLAQSTTGQT